MTSVYLLLQGTIQTILTYSCIQMTSTQFDTYMVLHGVYICCYYSARGSPLKSGQGSSKKDFKNEINNKLKCEHDRKHNMKKHVSCVYANVPICVNQALGEKRQKN